MKYKIEDKVRVKNNLKIGKKYGNAYFYRDMDMFSGKTIIISYADRDNDCYGIKSSPYSFTDEMLEPIEEKTFSREMLVSDNNHSFIKKFITAYCENLEYPYLSQNGKMYIGYKYAKEPTEPIELTMQEIADKFNIPVEQIKIKK